MRRIAPALYRVLLRLLAPEDLRREFGPQMEAVFQEILDEAETRGRLAVLRAWMREATQLVVAVRAFDQVEQRAPLRARAEIFAGQLAVAAKSLLRRPSYAGSVVLTLAIGPGLAAAVYSVARASILAPLPVPDEDRIVMITGREERPDWTGRTGITVTELQGLAESTTSLDRLAPFSLFGSVTLVGVGRPERWAISFVGPSYFSVLGSNPLLGRTLGAYEEEHPGAANVVLAHHVWTEQLGADPDILGRAIELSGVSYTVVGVMPPEFLGTSRRGSRLDAWLPLGRSPDILGGRVLTSIWNSAFWGVGRLADGVGKERALQELRATYEDLARARGLPHERSVDLVGLRSFHFRGSDRPVGVLALGSGLVLFVCALNLAFLVGLRGYERRDELAIRHALGSSRWRLAHGAAAEAMLLSAVGALAAWAVARLSVAVFLLRYDGVLFRLRLPSVDWRVGLLVLLVACVLTMLPSLWSVWTTRRRLALRGPGVAAGFSRSARWITGMEAALAVVVLVGAALSARSLRAVRGVDVGYDPRGLETARVHLTGSRHGDGEGTLRFARAVSEGLATSGVPAAVIGPDMLGRSTTHMFITPSELDPHDPAQRFRVQKISVSPGTFEALDMTLVAGRDLGWSDARDGLTATVVSERTAQRLWPGQSPIGKTFFMSRRDRPDGRVVGVVRDAYHIGRTSSQYVVGNAYFPLAQRPTPSLSVLYRPGASSRGTRVLDDVVSAVDDRVAVFDRASMIDRLRVEESNLTLALLLTSVYSAIVVFLTLTGLVSVVVITVRRRAPELAIRRALGAREGRLSWLLVRDTVMTLAGGIAVGAWLATSASAGLSGVVFGVSTTDPWTYGAVTSALLVVGLVSVWIPARACLRALPAQAIRAD